MAIRYRLWIIPDATWVVYKNGAQRSFATKERAEKAKAEYNDPANLDIRAVNEFGKYVTVESTRKGKKRGKLIVPNVRKVELQGEEFKIDAAVPFTQRNRPTQVKFLRTLVKLKIGESFLFPITSNHRNIVAACPILIGRRFVIRQEPGNIEYRVWRME